MKNPLSSLPQRILSVIALLTMLLAACGPSAPTADPNALMTAAFATVNGSFTQTALAFPTNTSAPTWTPYPFTTQAPQPTAFVPTVILQITVTIPANCRFGPDVVYVAPYGLRTGKVREAIGRDAAGGWLLVREPGGSKPCWVVATAVTVQGDPLSLPIAPVELPITNKYLPPANINVVRNADQATISWNEVILETRDIYTEGHYLLDVWLCKDGQLSQSLIGTNESQVTLTDSNNCSVASHGQIYTASKAGYSAPSQIPWR